MSDLEAELTNPEFIANELHELIEYFDELRLSIMEKRIHGESFADEKDTAESILARVKEVRDNDPKRQVISNALATDNLYRVLPDLLAKNNERLLTLFRELYLKHD